MDRLSASGGAYCFFSSGLWARARQDHLLKKKLGALLQARPLTISAESRDNLDAVHAPLRPVDMEPKNWSPDTTNTNPVTHCQWRNNYPNLSG